MQQSATRDGKSSWRSWWIIVLGSTILAVSGLLSVLVARRWPFTRSAVIEALQEGSEARVEVRTFRSEYFPEPRCVAEGVTFRRQQDGDRPPVMTVQRLTIQSSFISTLRKRVDLIRADGLYMRVQSLRSRPTFAFNRKFTVSHVFLNSAVVEFERRRQGNRPLRFEIHESKFDFSSRNSPISFSAALRNPEPPGEVQVSGRLGPWKADNAGQTPIAGAYTFRQARLGVFGGIAGTLSSEGKFAGVLDRLEVQGTTDTPEFQLTNTQHGVHLKTRFRAAVSGKNGNTFLQPVDAQFERTSALAQGKVAGTPQRKGKTALLNFSGKGRVQDLFWLFAKSNPPINGAITFQAQVKVPPGRKRFLQKVTLEGDFGVDAATLTNASRQKQVNQLSSRAQGSKTTEDPSSVSLTLKGHVILRDGVATFSDFSLRAPGASALLNGTYSLLDERVNLQGTLQMDASPSQATSGVKSAVLKVLSPFLKKNKRAGSMLPVRITGTYSQPAFGVALASSH